MTNIYHLLINAYKNVEANRPAMNLRREFSALAFIAFSISFMDCIQSFVLQKQIVSPYTELNVIPAWFFAHGFVGYLMYAPLEGAVTFGIFLVLWTLFYGFIFFYRSLRRSMQVMGAGIDHSDWWDD